MDTNSTGYWFCVQGPGTTYFTQAANTMNNFRLFGLAGGVMDVSTHWAAGTTSTSYRTIVPMAYANQGNFSVIQGSGTWTPTLGMADSGSTTGTGQINWTAGGFAARGNPLSVNFNGGATLQFGVTANFMPSGGGNDMEFGSPIANNVVTLQNPVNLNAATQAVYVMDNPNSAADSAVLNGAVTNGTLVKMGDGTLALNNASNSLTATVVRAGTLLANTSTSLGAGPVSLGDTTSTPSSGLSVVAVQAPILGLTQAQTNVTLSGTQTINASMPNAVTPANGQCVLLTYQTNTAQNGVWQVNTGGAWTQISAGTYGMHVQCTASDIWDAGVTYMARVTRPTPGSATPLTPTSRC